MRKSPDTVAVRPKRIKPEPTVDGAHAAMAIFRPDFTLMDMQRFATEAWGDLGTKLSMRWVEFNDRFFGGELLPIPLVITNTQPYGRRLAFCSHNPDGPYHRTITVNVPTYRGKRGLAGYRLLADNGVLLHEMTHQFLQ